MSLNITTIHSPSPKDFLKSIGPECVALFWVTSEPLIKRPTPFEDIDYLLDGTLLETWARLNSGEEQENSLFLWNGQNFGQSLMVMQVQNKEKKFSKETEEKLEQLMQIVKNQEGKEVVILFSSHQINI